MNDDAVQRGFAVRALGEVAIRCADLDLMVPFYRDVLGLKVLSGNEGEGIVFFDIGPGYGGHRTVLALFDHGVGRTMPSQDKAPETGARSSLHHIALTVGPEEQAAVIQWYEDIAQPYRIEEFDWIGWRGVFTRDPEGNTVELVAKIKEGENA